MFVVSVWEGQYIEELILNVTLFVVRFCGGQYREEMILNVTVFLFENLGSSIHRGTDTECYSVFCEFPAVCNIERN